MRACRQPWIGSGASSRAAGEFVLGAWIVLLVVSLPFFAMQTKHLTAGGFEVPARTPRSWPARSSSFPGVESEKLVFVFDNTKKDAAALDASINKATQQSGRRRRRRVAAGRAGGERGRRQADRAAGAAGHRRRDLTVDAAAEMRKNLGHPQGRRRPRCRSTSSASRRCGPACRTSRRRTSRRPSSSASRSSSSCCCRLRQRRRRAAAAQPRLHRGRRHRRDRLLPLAGREMSIFVTNIASMLGIGVAVDYSLFILSRYREEIAQGASETRRARPRCARRAWPSRSPA